MSSVCLSVRTFISIATFRTGIQRFQRFPSFLDRTVIQCRAAVAWEEKKPLSIEIIEVAPPKAGEVRIKVYYAGVCHSDAHHLDGLKPDYSEGTFPIILGHEGSGIVESVGEDVTEFQPGDHVIPNFAPQCRDCNICRKGKTNFCPKIKDTQLKGLMPDGTSRFTCKGKTLLHFVGCSTFSEYTVVAAISLSKINAAAPLKSVVLIGCGIPTGYGAAVNTAKVEKGSVCAVWGLGGVGLAAVMGCSHAGASRIFGIDTNSEKFEIAKQFGATECLNPKDYDKPIQQVIAEKTDGGLDFSIECIGLISTMEAAFEACHPLWGVAVIVGIASVGQRITANPFDLLLGRTWKGSFFGGFKSRDSIPALVEDYLAGKLKVDEFISHRMELDNINEAFDAMHAGKSIRSVITLSEA